jgi:hypothetical protein
MEGAMKRSLRSRTSQPDTRLDRRGFLEGLSMSAAGLLAAQAAGAAQPAPAGAAGTATTAGTSQPPPLREVAGKVAYVTGGSSGIGLATARVLREAGMKVVIGYIMDDQIAEAMSHFKDDPDVFAIKHDVLDRDGWKRTADAIEQRFGRTHLLVNNAGVGLNARATSATSNDWEWGVGVNFWGPVYGVQTFLPRMRAHNEGAHIATVGSISGMFAGSGTACIP